MPTPRFTSIPSRSSSAMRLAMMVLCVHAFTLRDDVVDDGSRCDDVVRRDDADGNDVLRVDDDRVCGHCHERIEVARREGVAEIAQVIGNERVHEREIGAERRLEQVDAAVDRDLLLALLDDRADAGRRQDAAEPEAARPDALDERPLRDEVHLQVPGEHLLLGLRIEADVTHDDPPQQLGSDELADADARSGGVVGDHREFALCCRTSSSISGSGVPTPMKPPTIRVAPVGIIATASGRPIVFIAGLLPSRPAAVDRKGGAADLPPRRSTGTRPVRHLPGCREFERGLLLAEQLRGRLLDAELPRRR